MSLPVSIQLFGLRNEMDKDPEAVIRALAEMGYDAIEPYSGSHGLKPEDFRKICDEVSIKASSIHTNYYALDKEPVENFSVFKTIGVKYAAYASFDGGYRPGDEHFSEVQKRVPEVSAIAAEYGIKLMYHNHDFEFQKIGDEYKLDYMFRIFPPEVIQSEIDTCWVNIAGENPSAYIRKYAGRCPCVHLKDFVYLDNGESAKTNESGRRSFEFRPVGDGIQDMPAILRAAEESGAKLVVVEQDNTVDGVSELDSAAKSRENLRKLGW